MTEGLEQPSGPLTPAFAPGAVVSRVTLVDVVDVHPLTGLVTVRVYVPVALTVGFCEVEVNPLGPVQLYVTPEVTELPERVSEFLVQVREPPVAVAPGAAAFWGTDAIAVEIQPLTGLVTVRV